MKSGGLLPLNITHRNENEVPTPSAQGRVNEDFESLKAEMSKLDSGMVLEINAGNEKAVRGTKMLITRAARLLGSDWTHWSNGTTIYARPQASTRRGRPKKTA